jgi:nucleoside-diphosphate-sugar epimerase
VIKANIAASTAPKAAGKVMNIACGSRITINELAQKIASLLGKELIPNYVASRVGDVKHSLADISRAQTFLDYSELVDVDSGLQKTVSWFTQA